MSYTTQDAVRDERDEVAEDVIRVIEMAHSIRPLLQSSGTRHGLNDGADREMKGPMQNSCFYPGQRLRQGRDEVLDVRIESLGDDAALLLRWIRQFPYQQPAEGFAPHIGYVAEIHIWRCERVDDAFEIRAPARARQGALHGLEAHGFEGVGAPVENGLEQAQLGAEVVVDQSDIYMRRRGNRAQRDAVQAVFRE